MNKKILLTGSKGFLGQHILQRLSHGNYVTTCDFSHVHINCDLSCSVPRITEKYDMVVHAAGRAHTVPKSVEENSRFFDANFRGTLNLLKALEDQLPKSLVFISTVAVYGLEAGTLITEDQPLNGDTPYVRSKIQAEQAVQEWGDKYDVPVVILRLPLIAGDRAPGNLGHMIRAIEKGYYLRAGNGKANRSMVLVQDLAEFIPSLFLKSGIYHLTDGAHPTLRELDHYIASHFNKKVISVPNSLLSVASRFGNVIPGFPINTSRLQKLQSTLTFSDRKAREELGWHSHPVVGNIWPSPDSNPCPVCFEIHKENCKDLHLAEELLLKKKESRVV